MCYTWLWNRHRSPAELSELLHACWLQAKTEGHEDATPEEGPWLFTLDAPSFQPVLTHVRNRSVSSLLCSP